MFTVQMLDKEMPSMEKLSPITQQLHSDRFFSYYASRDVWTVDGWLITAIANDGVTCHVRKGDKMKMLEIKGDDVVYVNMNYKHKNHKG